MYIYIYVCMHVCMYVCMYGWMDVYMYAFTQARLRELRESKVCGLEPGIYVCMSCIHVSLSICMYACKFVCVQVSLYVRMYACNACIHEMIDGLQHTATHCNTLQHTATHLWTANDYVLYVYFVLTCLYFFLT